MGNDDKSAVKSVTERTRDFEHRLLAKGGMKISGIRLSPEAADALRAIKSSTGKSTTAIINGLLLGKEI